MLHVLLAKAESKVITKISISYYRSARYFDRGGKHCYTPSYRSVARERREAVASTSIRARSHGARGSGAVSRSQLEDMLSLTTWSKRWEEEEDNERVSASDGQSGFQWHR